MRVAKVLAPVLKKMKRQSKRIEVLEEILAKQTKLLDTTLPNLETGLAKQEMTLQDACEQLRRQLGERVMHVDHARVEVGTRTALEGEIEPPPWTCFLLRRTPPCKRAQMAGDPTPLPPTAAQQRLLEEASGRMTAVGIHVEAMRAQVKEADDRSRRAVEAVEERVALLQLTVADGKAAADARRAELQLHVSETQAKLLTEMGELRRYVENELQVLKAEAASASKRADVQERLAPLDSGIAAAVARGDRLTQQVTTLQDEMVVLQSKQKSFAGANDVSELREKLSLSTRAMASGDDLAESLRQAARPHPTPA